MGCPIKPDPGGLGTSLIHDRSGWFVGSPRPVLKVTDVGVGSGKHERHLVGI
jgi:hypothetical protein